MEPKLHPLIAEHPGYRAALAEGRKAAEAYDSYCARLREAAARHDTEMSAWRARQREAASSGDPEALREPRPLPWGDEQVQADLLFAREQARGRTRDALGAAAPDVLPKLEAEERGVLRRAAEVGEALRPLAGQMADLHRAASALRGASGQEPLRTLPPRDAVELLTLADEGRVTLREAREVDAAAFEPPRRVVPVEDSGGPRVVRPKLAARGRR